MTANSAYRRLTGIEQMYLTLESPTTPMHFGALVVLDGTTLLDADGRLRLDDLRRAIEDRVGPLPELRRAIHQLGPFAGAPLWVDDPDFRIERHVGEAATPVSRVPMGEDALLRFVERLMAPPLDRAHPLWRLWFVTGMPDGRVGLLFIVHHALADGLSAMRLAQSLLGDPPVAPHPDGPTPVPSPVPGWAGLVSDNLRTRSAGVRALVSPATRRAIGAFVRSFAAGVSATRGEPRSSLNAAVGRRRRLVVVRLDAAAAKRVARTDDVGVNDVVLGLLAGGLRALLDGRGEPVDRWEPRVGIAVALPPSERDDAGGNQFGSYWVALPIGEADPPERVRRVAAARDRSKRTQSVTGVTGIRVWTTRFWPMRQLMGRQRFINLMETFVPGPPRPIELLGAPALDLIPIQPLGRNVGLTVLASSYAGRLTIAVRVDSDAFPDLDVLLGAIQRDWQTLSLAVSAQR
jgi:WS/DGAT/MGAT family acyltransferase